jgi:hypothetical protein
MLGAIRRRLGGLPSAADDRADVPAVSRPVLPVRISAHRSRAEGRGLKTEVGRACVKAPSRGGERLPRAAVSLGDWGGSEGTTRATGRAPRRGRGRGRRGDGRSRARARVRRCWRQGRAVARAVGPGGGWPVAIGDCGPSESPRCASCRSRRSRGQMPASAANGSSLWKRSRTSPSSARIDSAFTCPVRGKDVASFPSGRSCTSCSMRAVSLRSSLTSVSRKRVSALAHVRGRDGARAMTVPSARSKSPARAARRPALRPAGPTGVASEDRRRNRGRVAAQQERALASHRPPRDPGEQRSELSPVALLFEEQHMRPAERGPGSREFVRVQSSGSGRWRRPRAARRPCAGRARGRG